MTRVKPLAFALAALVACGGAVTAPAASQAAPPEIGVVVPKEPAVARYDGRRHLLYEIVVLNPGTEPVVLESLDVDAGAFARKTIAASELRARTKALVVADVDAVEDMRAVAKAPKAGPREVPGGGAAAIFVRLQTEDDAAPPPATIRNVVTVRDGARAYTRTVDVATSRAPELVLAPPLDGDGWIAHDGPVDTSHHRRTLLRFHGAWHLGQRFAVDWARVGGDGALVRPGAAADANASYLGWGASVHAVADATVAAMRDGIAENAGDAGFPASSPITLDNVAGNAVVLDLGDGRFAAYGHLQPGSIRVAIGDAVKRGQVIARLGNSGNSGLPHLHFQVCDAPSFLVCEGVPYVFASFGHAPTDDAGAKTGPYARAERELLYVHHAIDFGEPRLTMTSP